MSKPYLHTHFQPEDGKPPLCGNSGYRKVTVMESLTTCYSCLKRLRKMKPWPRRF